MELNNTIGWIDNELNLIRARYSKKGERSESYIKYYNQIEQPTQTKEISTKKIIPFDDYFGAYWTRLIDPLIYWNGFYIAPGKVDSLLQVLKERRLYHNNKFVSDIDEIRDYILEYRKGFIEGYENFDKIEIANKFLGFRTEELSINSIKKIINYIDFYKENEGGGFVFSTYSVRKYVSSMSKDGYIKPTVDKIPFSIEDCRKYQDESLCSERLFHAQETMLFHQGINVCKACHPYVLPKIDRWYQKGFEGGKYYRAWFIVLANYQMFDDYFRTTTKPALDEIITPQQTEIEEPYNKVGLKNLLLRIQFDKDEVTKNKVEDYLIRLSKIENFTNANGKEFTAVAFIFFQTGWVVNTSTFSEWSFKFSSVFDRKKSTYKINQVEGSIEVMKIKIPFLDKLPIK